MSIEETIILSVISGIFTSALIFLCVAIFNKIIVPWYRKTIYRGLDINGVWKSIQEHSRATDTINLNISQNEQYIKGTLTLIKSLKQTDKLETKILDISGVFQDGHLMLLGNSKDRRIRSHMTYLASITSGGIELKGMYSLVESNVGKIISIETIFTRENAYRDRGTPHSAPLPHHAANGSVLRGSADQAGSEPGEQKSK